MDRSKFTKMPKGGIEDRRGEAQVPPQQKSIPVGLLRKIGPVRETKGDKPPVRRKED